MPSVSLTVEMVVGTRVVESTLSLESLLVENESSVVVGEVWDSVFSVNDEKYLESVH